MRIRVKALSALTVTAALVLSGCGSDDNQAGGPSSGAAFDCASGSISGAGSTFAQNIVQQWIKDYTARCQGATINYQSVGSGAGIQQFLAGTVDFAGSDVPLKPAEEKNAEGRYGSVVHAPWSAGGIAVMYNLQGVENLRLSPATLAGIFAGTVRRWDDPALKADNPGAKLPSTAVQVLHRSDGSGTTESFTSYLTAVAPAVWTVGSGKDVAWPTGQGAKGSDGVTGAIKATTGSIGYAELSYAQANKLGVARIQNAAGQFVSPSDPGSVTAALSGAKADEGNKVAVNYIPADPKAYPISTVTYVIAPKSPSDPAKAALLESFLTYALSQGQEAAESLAYAPVAESLLEPARRTVAGISEQPPQQ